MGNPSLTLSVAEPGRLFQDILPWAIAIVGLAVVGAIVIMVVRRALRSEGEGVAPGFTLQSLREMREQGQITEEEFQRAREAMIGQVKGPAEKPSPTAETVSEQTGRDGSTGAESAEESEKRTADSDKPDEQRS